MLTEISIQNFKAWKDSGPIRLAPLTVIFGANSAGKSSLGHLLLALKQTTMLTDRKRALHLGDASSLIDLGTFADCIHAHNLKNNLEFSLSWRLDAPLILRDPIKRSVYTGTDIKLSSVIKAGKNDQPFAESFEYSLINSAAPIFNVEHTSLPGRTVSLVTTPPMLKKAQGRVWPLEPPEKFYKFSDVTLARFQNADFLAKLPLELEHLLERIYYLGPLRSHPERIYQWSGDTPSEVGARGEFTIASLLAAASEDRKIKPPQGKNYQKFDAYIAGWLKEMGIISSFQVKPVAKGRKEFEVLIKTHPSSAEVKLTDVGFGVSQVLPALVEAFYAPPNSTVWMEQPEIHLHPQVQAALADVFIAAIQAREKNAPRNVQLIVESHSEHLLMRLQRRIAEGTISPSDIAIYFCSRQNEQVVLSPLELNQYGEINNWPDNFFGDELAEVTARTVAAMQRKIEERKAQLP